jgi:4-amino-4-deoxy-L-arabinose transferase-like glycosyltransferase
VKAGRSRLALGGLLPLSAALALSFALKGTLVAMGVVDFTSDEGVVSLMARHITQGQWPVFYYGEAYVGSLGATIIAAAFVLVGESVATVRIVQMVLYAGCILCTCLLARRIYDQKAAFATALMMALPPVMITLYTTVAIGAYGEILFLGAFLLWAGHRLVHECADKWIWWLVWGAVAGLGFWSLGLIVVYVMPVVLLWIRHFAWRRWPLYLLAILGFVVGSSPWWIYDFTHNHAALRVLYDPSSPIQIQAAFTLAERLTGLTLLGLPALVGLRFPWAAEYILIYLAPLILTFYVIVLIGNGRQWPTLPPKSRTGISILVLFAAGFVLFFVGTRFGIDATGRYLLPLYPPLCIMVGGWWTGLRPRLRTAGSVALALVLAFNLAGVALAARDPVGLTTQFIPALQVGNAYDEELIAFLLDNGMPYGYSHHWVSFKIAFLSQEQVVLAPLLPFRINAYDDPDRANRYPPYAAAAESAVDPVYVTSNQPWLDDLLRQRFSAQGIYYEVTTIGPYRIFHHLSRTVSPETLGQLFTREH